MDPTTRMTTRSQGPPSITSSEGSLDAASGGFSTMTPAELEIINKKMIEKEKLLREQAKALRDKEEELDQKCRENEQGRSSTDARLNRLERMLTTLAADLPEQLNTMSQRLNDLQGKIGYDMPRNEPPVSRIQEHDRVGFDTPRSEEPRLQTRGPGPGSPSEPPVSPIRLKDVIDSIPKYDGHKMSVFYFCKMCERALKLIPPNQEYHLVQLILNKLQGHAYSAIEGSENTTVHELTKRLRRIFGPNKSTDQYRGELANIYMKQGENLFDYIERVKELQTAILDGESTDYGYLDSAQRAAIEHTTMESFVNGLPSDLLIRVKLEKCYTLEGTIMTTVQLSKQLEAENLRKKQKTYDHSFRADVPQNYGAPLNNKTVNFRSTPMTSTNNPQRGSAGPSPFIKPLVPGQPGPNTPKSCYYCKTPGHFMSECRKLAYRRSIEGTVVPATPDSGNASSVPGTSGVNRDATPPGRPVTNTSIMRKPASQITPLPTLPE